MSDKDFLSVLVRPLLTERSAQLKDEQGKYFFEVRLDSNKGDIKRAVQELFKVKVTKVATMIMHGKVKRMGRTAGQRPDWKKAIVTLKKGEKIDVVEQAA
jgi:large subunit ribosomal protein L23